MDLYLFVKLLHILSAAILFGTGTGIAFFMIRALATENIHEQFYAARNTVLADYVFTLPAVIVQPLTGAWLVWQGGYGWLDPWLVATYILYTIVGMAWLPVVWIQIALKKIAADCVDTASPLPPRWYRLFRHWIALGFVGFAGVIGIFFLMVMKPV